MLEPRGVNQDASSPTAEKAGNKQVSKAEDIKGGYCKLFLVISKV